MRTYNKKKRQKAAWYRSKYGDAEPRKYRKPVPKISKRQSKRLSVYHARVKVWKRGRNCVGNVIRYKGKPVCNPKEHPCQDCHHSRGRLGPLLMDERFWIPVCWRLHAFIGEHPAAAVELKLLASGPWNTLPRQEAA